MPGGAEPGTAQQTRGSLQGAVWPWDCFPLPATDEPCGGGAGGWGLPAHIRPTQATAARPGPQSPHPLNEQRALEEPATAGAALSPSCPSSPLLFSAFPWAVTHPTTRALVQPSGSCPHPSALSGEPLAAPSHPTQPTILWPVGSQDRASRRLPGEGCSCAFLGLLRTSGAPAPSAKQPSVARTQIPPTSQGQPGGPRSPGSVRPAPRPWRNGPKPGPPWGWGPGLGANTEAFVQPHRHKLHFPGCFSLWPALFPADRTSCSVPPSVPPACWQGGRLTSGCWEQEDGRLTPSERLSPGKPRRSPHGGFHPLPPSAVWPQAPGSKWADGLRIRLALALLTPF